MSTVLVSHAPGSSRCDLVPTKMDGLYAEEKQELVGYINAQLDDWDEPVPEDLSLINRFSGQASVSILKSGLNCTVLTNKQAKNKKDHAEWLDGECFGGDRFGLQCAAIGKAVQKFMERRGGSDSALAQHQIMNGN